MLSGLLQLMPRVHQGWYPVREVMGNYNLGGAHARGEGEGCPFVIHCGREIRCVTLTSKKVNARRVNFFLLMQWSTTYSFLQMFDLAKQFNWKDLVGRLRTKTFQ